MANGRLMIDTSILIDYFRRTDKKRSRLVQHFREYDSICVSSITEFEILNGAKQHHQDFWEGLASHIEVVSFDSRTAREAARIVSALKLKRKTMDKPDLFIAATAIVHDLAFDTLNTKHFLHVDELKLLPQSD